MKKLLIGLLLTIALPIYGQFFGVTHSGMSNNVIVSTGPLILKSFTLTSISNDTAIVRLYDDGANTTMPGDTYGWAVSTNDYVSVILTNATETTNVITTTGVTNSYTNIVAYTLYTTNTGFTNELTPVWIGAVNASTPVVINGLNMRLGRGLCMSNTAGGVTISGTYQNGF